MQLSLSKEDLASYISSQVNNLFPDKNTVRPSMLSQALDKSLNRLEHCFSQVSYKHYSHEGQTFLNHLYTDQYLVFLWFLANTVWKESGNDQLASKLYYLNKSLHGFDCMYNTGLPDIFLVFHGVGTMLGKAEYADYFVVLQGCTVGSQKGEYPRFGKGVGMAANSSVIGNCKMGDRTTISTRTTLFSKDLDADTTVFMNWESGKQEIKQAKNCYAQQFFTIDLKSL
jgi:serine O-acetyltransferase